jgi:hypothetical protein
MKDHDTLLLENEYLKIEALQSEEDTEQLYTIFINKAFNEIKNHSTRPLDINILERVINSQIQKASN